MMVVEVVLEDEDDGGGGGVGRAAGRVLAGIPGKDVHTPLTLTVHRALNTVHCTPYTHKLRKWRSK